MVDIQDLNTPEDGKTPAKKANASTAAKTKGIADTATSPVIAVTAVQMVGDRYVIEWHNQAGSLCRAFADGQLSSATEDELLALEPYGDDLSEIVEEVVWTKDEQVDELHRMGVWRLSDLNANNVSLLHAGLGRKASSDILQRVNRAKAQ